MGYELTVSHSDMNAAFARGEAAPLADSISWLARYRDSWWVVYEDGWLRITNDLGAPARGGCAAGRTASAAPTPDSADAALWRRSNQ